MIFSKKKIQIPLWKNLETLVVDMEIITFQVISAILFLIVFVFTYYITTMFFPNDPKSSDGYNIKDCHRVSNSNAILKVVNGKVVANASGGCPGSPSGRLSTLNSMRNQACGVNPRNRKKLFD